MKPIHITKTLAGVALAAGALLGCKPQLDAPAPVRGTADFTRYIAVGNSLTAGYADNGLYRAGQLNSYPSIIAQQLQKAGGAAQFRQPLFPENQANGTGYLVLTGITGGLPVLSSVPPQAIRGRAAQSHPLYNPDGVLLTKYTEPVENYGVPNLRLSDVIDNAYAAKNPFYERILADNEQNKPYLTKVAEANPTFFSCWAGNSDALHFAISGGQIPLTPVAVFGPVYDQLLNSLTQNRAKGVVANIAGVTTIPFMTTLGAQIKARLPQNTPLFVRSGPGDIQRPDLDSVIQTTVGNLYSSAGGTDLIPLTASAYQDIVGQRTGRYWRDFARTRNIPVFAVMTIYSLDTTQAFGLHPRNPLPTALMLDRYEVRAVNEAVQAYNNIIRTMAGNKGLAFVDANALLQRFQTGSIYNGVAVNSTFISGGLFSLDGVHLTPRGYAIAANEFIKAINAKYASTIPLVDVNNYPAVRFP